METDLEHLTFFLAQEKLFLFWEKIFLYFLLQVYSLALYYAEGKNYLGEHFHGFSQIFSHCYSMESPVLNNNILKYILLSRLLILLQKASFGFFLECCIINIAGIRSNNTVRN